MYLEHITINHFIVHSIQTEDRQQERHVQRRIDKVDAVRILSTFKYWQFVKLHSAESIQMNADARQEMSLY